MATLTISIIQSNLHWEDAGLNRAMFEEKILSIPSTSELIILPEAFNSGFSMNAKQIAETMQGDTILWMKKMAKAKNAIIAGSLFIKENNKYYNRLIWMLPHGEFGYYDKRHLFSLAGENEQYSAGSQRIIAQVNGFKINLQICYDLRFPIWSRQQQQNEYDILLFVANWPDKRILAWNTLLQARAIENQCFVIGVNRTGEDGNGIFYSGHSAIYDPMGDPIYLKKNEEDIFTYTINKSAIENIRKTIPFLKDKDDFRIF